MTLTKVGRVWIDFPGNTRLQTLLTSSGDTTLAAAAKAVSNADSLYEWDGTYNIFLPVPAMATYETVYDVANLTFSTGAGNLVTYKIYAPQQAIFLADSETVDPTTITTVIAAAIATLVDTSGNPVVSYVSGTRSGRGG